MSRRKGMDEDFFDTANLKHYKRLMILLGIWPYLPRYQGILIILINILLMAAAIEFLVGSSFSFNERSAHY